MKSIVIIGNNSKVAQSIGCYLSRNYTVYYTGRSGTYNFYLDLQSSPKEIKTHPTNIDAVINCAAGFGGDENENYNACVVNGGGSITAFEFAKKVNAKHFIHISSSCVLEPHDGKYYGIYGASKKFGEQILELYRQNSDMLITIMRPTGIYDSLGKLKIHQKLFYKIIDSAYFGQNFIMHGIEDPYRDYIFVNDLSKNIELVLEKHIVGNFNCTGESLTIAQIAKICFSIFEKGGKVVRDTSKESIQNTIIPKNNIFSIMYPCQVPTSIHCGIKLIKSDYVP